MKFKNFLIGVLIAGMFILGFSFYGCSKSSKETNTLLVYSGAGLRKPMDEIGKTFEKQYGIQIQYNYEGSAQNLSQIELSQEGDVYIPGAKHYIKSCLDKGYVKYTKDVVLHIPVIAVPKGNPANIKSLEDLTNKNVEVILGDERAAAIGRVAQKMLKKNNIRDRVEKNVVTKDATVNEVVVHITMAQGDAAIVWEDNVAGNDEVDIVRIDPEKNLIKTIPIGALTFSEKNEMAKKFVNFVASEKGKEIFEKHGFKRIGKK